jgi:hypothetical protein
VMRKHQGAEGVIMAVHLRRIQEEMEVEELAAASSRLE